MLIRKLRICKICVYDYKKKLVICNIEENLVENCLKRVVGKKKFCRYLRWLIGNRE